MSAKRPVLTIAALNATDYRAFLLAILRAGRSEIPRGGLSALARRSGLSRSFLTELLKGKKAFSGRSMAKVADALSLHGDLRRYFEALVATEEAGLREQIGVKSEKELHMRRERLRARLRQKQANAPSGATSAGRSYLSLDVFCVYAALGSGEHGVSVPDLSRRTSIDPKKVNEILEKMAAVNWVRRTGDRWHASERAIDIDELGNDLGFAQAFSEAAFELSRNSRRIAAAPGTLTFFSVIPVSSSQLDEFKSRLRSAVLDVLDEFQDDSGTSVQLRKITLGLH